MQIVMSNSINLILSRDSSWVNVTVVATVRDGQVMPHGYSLIIIQLVFFLCKFLIFSIIKQLRNVHQMLEDSNDSIHPSN